MAQNARRFSQITDDSETSIGVFANSRSSTDGTQDFTREPKRRRTSGLNARFDNMVRTMNATYSGPQNPRQHQTRTRSSSDASHLSSGIADAYSALHEGRIGENFTLIKTQPLVDGHHFADQVQQIKMPNTRLQDRAENTPPVRKALPEWLCSTFSTLTAKHPLRLLLPKKSPCPLVDTNDQNGSDDSKIDPTFAFSPDQPITQTMPNDRVINFIGSTSNGHHAVLSSTVPQSTTLNVHRSKLEDNTQEYRSPSATCRDHVSLPLDVVLFSTPGPPVISVPQRPTTKMSQAREQDSNLPPEFQDLAFIPFSTPGPASALQSVVTNLRSDLYAPNCLVDMDTETSACSPRRLTSTLLSTSASHTMPRSRHTSNESSAIDFCLPPYHAAPSDPAPAYSDGIYDDAYYADPLTDETGSEPEGIPERTNDVFATPAPGYCAPRPIYFDSPTEEPSDPDHLKPGYEIDLDAINFKWTPFNRKSIQEQKLAPRYERRLESCQSPVFQYQDCPQSETCAVRTRTKFPKDGLPSDSLPSSSPFRFTPHQLTAKTILKKTTSTHAKPPTIQTKPPQPFAPAPGIFVSPLREKPEIQILAPRTPQSQIIRTESRKADLNVKTNLSSSQGSHDSIQSWRDVDEDCLLKN
ncbi:hypothetical protein C0995_002191 [Termitomyces sp. Mi166|nr:hypothetical protein C0995_002191 [Termitomyces sp. Mi166\